MKKRLLSVLILLGLLLLLSGCAAHKVDVPALEFGGTEGDVSVLRLYFDGDSPVFLENGFTDLCDLYVTGHSIGTYLTLRCSKRRIRRPFTSCREATTCSTM